MTRQTIILRVINYNNAEQKLLEICGQLAANNSDYPALLLFPSQLVT